MQFIRQGLFTKRAIRQLSTNVKVEAVKKGPKIPRYSPQSQEILDNYMIPGPFLRYFKNKREKTKVEDNSVILDVNENMYTSPARPVSFNEFDSAPTVTQERLAARIKRAITNMYSVESLPNQWVTPAQLTVRDVKVSRNLRKCRVLYEPLSNNKKERGNVHRALTDYNHLLNALIRQHAQLRRPLSIKFVPDTQTRELEAIFEKISKEESSNTE